ncbi:MAG TPA: class I SAM-dependent methyltransferase [Candidatus Limnocylindrales bacterium]|nr:class I SAM-dependent methyltransferase [Candidatus Limnocylindrales bacterium]
MKRNLDEGLGTVYERFMLNNLFDELLATYPIHNVLEVPIYGMSGLTGINSLHFAKKGCRVTLVDKDQNWLLEAQELWKMADLKDQCQPIYQKDLSRLPFKENSFDLVWNFAALWFVEQAESLLRDMIRVSSNLVLIAVPNPGQPGYFLRKYCIDPDFFKQVDEKWVRKDRICRVLASENLQIIRQGILDIPPWPDTCVPIKHILQKFGIRLKENPSTGSPEGGWTWNIMDYYLGRNPGLKEKVERFSFLEKSPLPYFFKALWAHHHYILGKKPSYKRALTVRL